MLRRLYHQAAACTHATLHLRHEHRRTICRMSDNARSQDNHTARLHREGKMPSLEELLRAVQETRAEYREKILAARRGKQCALVLEAFAVFVGRFFSIVFARAVGGKVPELVS